MAVVSTHILNSVDGSHAAGVKLRLINLATGETLFETATDTGGRMKQDVANPDPAAEYELSMGAGDYWAAHNQPTRLTEIALRFHMPQANQTYHSPIILAPNGHSVWISE